MAGLGKFVNQLVEYETLPIQGDRVAHHAFWMNNFNGLRATCAG
jgi:hypothetical protein